MRGNPKSSKLRIGDVVLLQEDISPLHTWKTVRLEELIFGRNEKVRTCAMRTNGRIFAQPVQLVILLELNQVGEDVERLNSTRSLK
ncbi:hypothetical protein TNIN_103521 [Trichonephila inaurata madagascariensis]|uniref:DUF5641 domain-containing protein n=1 Tax=Trichonephila inaurata madagascariensis TaxID=2747483 RepID=A0A8X6X6V8_9ARAC|nr:hypothetical protein TNIN_103521 [Trichonephila inaurata madagascariensis]